jgi:hypothetical protein
MLDHPDPQEAAPRPKRVSKLRGPGARGGRRLRPGPKPNALSPDGVLTNVEAVRRLASLNCTLDECAGWFGLSQPTLNSRFNAYPELRQAWETGRGEAMVSLRRNLFARAQKKSADGLSAALFLAEKMLIWPADTGDDGYIVRPAAPAAPAAPPLDCSKLSTEELELLERLAQKARVP